MRSYRLVLSLLFSVLLLSACQHTILNPQPMGRGYSPFKEPYKSAHGVDAKAVGYEFSVEDNQAIIEDMRFAAQDLVQKIDDQISFSMDQIYLDVPQSGVFYSSFDYVLRDEFTKHGYVLAITPERALPVTVVAYEPKDLNAGKARDGYRMLYLGLALDVVDGKAGTIIGYVYEVPVYDFQPTKALKIADKKCCGCDKCKQGKACGGCAEKGACKKPENAGTEAETVDAVAEPVPLKDEE